MGGDCRWLIASPFSLPPNSSPQVRRKHQISQLFYDAKLREIELGENRARGMKTRAETQSKYGWR